MAVATTRVGKRGTVVIPSELRRRYGITEGSLVIAEAQDDGILIRPAVARPVDLGGRRRLLEAANRDYAALRADRGAWRAELAERELWDAMLQDGLDRDEVWTDDGGVEPAKPVGDP
jgi:AbrB family looped-hinge helix DNA binding protein